MTAGIFSSGPSDEYLPNVTLAIDAVWDANTLHEKRMAIRALIAAVQSSAPSSPDWRLGSVTAPELKQAMEWAVGRDQSYGAAVQARTTLQRALNALQAAPSSEGQKMTNDKNDQARPDHPSVHREADPRGDDRGGL